MTQNSAWRRRPLHIIARLVPAMVELALADAANEALQASRLTALSR